MVVGGICSFAVNLPGDRSAVGEDNLPIERVGFWQEERQQHKEPLSHNGEEITERFEPIYRIVEPKD